MPRTCPRCSQLNPDEALYCWSDGGALDGPTPPAQAPAIGARPFSFPFVFISGRVCRSFDELVLACEEEWDEAWELLREGFLESFFNGLGRDDLAAAARKGAAEADPSVGLDLLLAHLPGDARLPPRLGVRPQEFNLGQLPVGTSRRFDLCVTNEGMGLLTGRIMVSGADWLALGDGAGAPEKVFRCHDGAIVPVQVIGDRLRAGPPQKARLFIASGGGPACVVIRVETPVVPFAEGVLAGADSPRALAELARAAPAAAATLFENGAVAAWYQANGWTYPVRGRPAAGVAAVQQFFEALGLSDPPRVEIDRFCIELEGPPGAALEAALTLEALDPRPVYADATSLEPWLTAGEVVLDGPRARIPLRVAAMPDRPGERLTGQVQVTANGGQHFIVEVVLVVEGAVPSCEPADAGAPCPRAPEMPAVPAVIATPDQWMWVATGGLLLVALMAVAATAVVLLRRGNAVPTAVAPPPTRPAAAWEDAPPGPPFAGNAGPVLAAAFTSDGGLLTAAGGVERADGRTAFPADNAIHRWAADGREIQRLRGFQGGVAVAAFSPDGRLAAVTSFGVDHTIHLWDLREPRETQTLIGHNAAMTCLTFTPDGKRVVSGGADGTVRVWEAATGESSAVLKGHDGPVECVAVSPDGRRALSGGADHAVFMWDLIRGRSVRTFDGHKDAVRAAGFSPDGKLALSAGGGEFSADHATVTPGARDCDVRLWDLATGKVRRLKGLAQVARVAAFSADGGRILAGGDDGTVMLWRAADGKLLRRYDGHAAAVRCAAFSPDGRRAVTGADDAALKIWDLPPSASELIRLLAADDPAERLRAARELAECGPEAASAYRPLLDGLRGGDADFRAAALAALPRIGAPTRADVGVLEGLVRDGTFPAGRDYALDALAALGPDARPAALTLYGLLTDAAAGSAVRCKAARALGAIGPNAEVRAFVDLYRVMADPNPAVSAAAADAMDRTCPPVKGDLTELQLHLHDAAPAVRLHVLRALAALGPDAHDAAPRLAEEMTREPRADLRLAALQALRAAAPLDAPSVAAFGKALDDADPSVPPEAAKALAAAGPDRGGLPGLLHALGQKDFAVRRTAEDALKNARLAPEQVRLLGEAVKTGDPDTRERLLAVLEALGPDAAEAMPGLRVLLRDGPMELRRRAVDVVAQTGPAGKRAGGELAARLGDKDESLRFAAALALVNLGADEAQDGVPLLVAALWVENQDNAAAVGRREKAREALATIGGPAVKELTEALAGDFADSPRAPNSIANALARMTAVRALKEMGAAARSADTLRVLDDLDRRDPSREVRDAAREAIASIGRPSG
jgi:hypothetical protein